MQNLFLMNAGNTAIKVCIFPLSVTDGLQWNGAGKDDSLLRRGFQLEEMPPALSAAVL